MSIKLEVEMTRQDYLDFNLYHFNKKRLKSTVVTGIIAVGALLFVTARRRTVEYP